MLIMKLVRNFYWFREAIIRVAGSSMVVELMRHGYSPTDACKEVVNRIIKKHSDLTNLQCGFIAIDKKEILEDILCMQDSIMRLKLPQKIKW